MSDTPDDADRAANALCEVTLALEDIDLNALLDDDVLEVLEYKQNLSDMCGRYRREQHRGERAGADADATAGDEVSR